ncbi:MAG: LysE family translocator [Alphaproteobacteria bacterium]|nr:LysE family translocator [Alphaproteobacteria bacterium]
MLSSADSLAAVALVGIALSATPGPSMLYVLSRTVGQSRAAGIASALGLCLGGVVLAVATALGLAAVFAAFDGLVTALRFVGAAYLVWLGIGMTRDAQCRAKASYAAQDMRVRPLTQIMWQGVLVEVLNPKTVLFFALFLPPFIPSEAAEAGQLVVAAQLLILGALVPLTAVPSDVFVALMGGAMTRTLNESRRARVAMSWIGGSILIGIAASLVWQALAAGGA